MRDPHHERERAPFDRLRDLGFTGASRSRQWLPTPKGFRSRIEAFSGPAERSIEPPTATPLTSLVNDSTAAEASTTLMPARATPRIAATAEDLMTLSAIPDEPDAYAVGKVLRHLGLSHRGATAILRYVPEAHKGMHRPEPGIRMLTVDRAGLGYVILRYASAAARVLHPWALRVTQGLGDPPALAGLPPRLNSAGSPSPELAGLFDLLEVTESRVQAAQAVLADALSDLSAALRSVRASLRDQP